MANKVMDSSKEMLELWSDTQQKLVQNWVDTSKKFQTYVQEGKSLEHSLDSYKEWFDSQRSILNEAFEKGVAQAPTDAMPEQVRTWLEKQREFTKNSIDMMNELMQKQMDAPADFQKMSTNPQEAYKFWADYFKKWYAQTMEMMGGMKEYLPSSGMSEMYENMVNSSKSYFNMYEMWENYNKMVKNGNFDANSYFKMFDMQKYSSMMNDMTKNIMPFKFHDVSEQANTFIETYRNMLMGSANQMPYKEIWAKYLDMVPNMSNMMNMMPQGGSMPQMSEFQEQMVSRMQKLYAPFYKMVPPSKEKEMGQMLVDMQTDLLKYQTKMYEMNMLIGQAAKEANEVLMKDLFEAAKNGEQPKMYNEYFTQWLDTLESHMVELFKSDDFSKVQGEVLALQLDLKTAVNKGIENALSPYPIVLNSEVDQLTKQIHDLKAKVRNLEKEGAKEEPKKAAAPATAKKTATTAKKTTSSTAAKKAADDAK
ncbi:MAG: hypothetical protein JJT94_12095 [Bernardetiaceae bacterium]|nr:hypothetical protein [Bernardetiaceae bacterium]